MSYLYHIKKARWIRGWSEGKFFYRLSIGNINGGSNGAEIPSLTEAEETAITDFFLEHGVVENATHTDLWWTKEKFGEHTPSRDGSSDEIGDKIKTIYEGGIKFTLSLQGYERVFNS